MQNFWGDVFGRGRRELHVGVKSAELVLSLEMVDRVDKGIIKNRMPKLCADW